MIAATRRPDSKQIFSSGFFTLGLPPKPLAAEPPCQEFSVEARIDQIRDKAVHKEILRREKNRTVAYLPHSSERLVPVPGQEFTVLTRQTTTNPDTTSTSAKSRKRPRNSAGSAGQRFASESLRTNTKKRKLLLQKSTTFTSATAANNEAHTGLRRMQGKLSSLQECLVIFNSRAERAKRFTAGGLCLISRCENKLRARGLCSTHYSVVHRAKKDNLLAYVE